MGGFIGKIYKAEIYNYAMDVSAIVDLANKKPATTGPKGCGCHSSIEVFPNAKDTIKLCRQKCQSKQDCQSYGLWKKGSSSAVEYCAFLTKIVKIHAQLQQILQLCLMQISPLCRNRNK